MINLYPGSYSKAYLQKLNPSKSPLKGFSLLEATALPLVAALLEDTEVLPPKTPFKMFRVASPPNCSAFSLALAAAVSFAFSILLFLASASFLASSAFRLFSASCC